LILKSLGADDRESPEVRLETFPSVPTAGNPWSVYILVKHSNPLEVDVRPPHFPPYLVLDRVRADSRLFVDGERWTRVEFRFSPLREGTINLEPFEVRTPAGLAFSDRVNISFGVETVRQRFDPRFRWLLPVPAVTPGETAELILELTNWNPNRRVPEGFFGGRAPLNAIVREDFPFIISEGIYHYPVRLTPLEESNVILQAFSLTYGNYNLNIPRVELRVLPVLPVVEEAVVSGEAGPYEDSARMIPFPEVRERVFFLFQNEYDRTISRARALWNESRRAESLAEIRRNERDSFSGPFLVPLRLELEQELGLGFTENERWRPLRIPLFVYLIFILAIISALVSLFVLRPGWFIQRRKLIFIRRNSFISVIILILAAGLTIIFIEGSAGDFPGSRSSRDTAVLKNTYSYRIPDFRGAVNDRFTEGQPVIVGDYSGDWRLAETSDGRSGWVPREMVISY